MVQLKNYSVTSSDGMMLVDQIDLEIPPGKSVAIVGESGSGKSLTALGIWALLTSNNLAFRGTLTAFGTTLPIGNTSWIATTREWYGRKIGFVFQDPMTALHPTKTCGSQLTEAVLTADSNKKAVAVAMLNQVGLDASAMDKYPFQLSGGQQQRIMIAMALINNPEVIIADEPNTALDVESSKQVVALLRQLQLKYKSSLLFVSHDFGLVGDIADHIAVMYKGKIVESTDASSILNHPEHAYTKALLASRPHPNQKKFLLPEVADWMSDTYEPQTLPAKTNSSSDISIDQLVGGYFNKEQFTQVAGPISLDFNCYNTIGIVGKSGSGKSTLAKTLVGAIPGNGGEIQIGRETWSLPLKNWTSLRSQIQYVFQDPYGSLNPSITIGKQLALPFLNAKKGGRTAAKEKVLALLLEVGLLEDDYQKYPHQFSGGQRQRLVICRALVMEPKLLVCDESVSALDVSVQAKILNLLHQIQAKRGLKILFISHDPDVVHYFCDYVIRL